MAHISKGSNLEMGENLLPSSSSESKKLLPTDIEMGENVIGRYSSEKLEESVQKKEMEEPPRKCCIYRVPRNLRKVNEEAYTPQVVSIGPLHHGKEEHLIEMEQQKERYVEKFGERTSMDKLMEFKSFIEEKESRIRTCYAENPIIQKDEFVKIILHDAVFIIELFLINNQTFREFDILLDTPIRRNALDRDLQLLENQLPYFVLKELFSKLDGEDRNYRDPFLILASRFFKDCELNHLTHSTHNIRHFTDLRRRILLKEFNPPNNIPDDVIRGLRCATKLDGSGVKFKKGDGEGSSLEIGCEYVKRPSQIMFFNKVHELELKISHFNIYGSTECLIRNVMAFEELQYPCKTHVCNYILLMDFLSTPKKTWICLLRKESSSILLGTMWP